MARRAFTPEQTINKLREAEVHLSQGDTVGEASRKIGELLENKREKVNRVGSVSFPGKLVACHLFLLCRKPRMVLECATRFMCHHMAPMCFRQSSRSCFVFNPVCTFHFGEPAWCKWSRLALPYI